MEKSGSHSTIQHDGTVKKVDANSVIVSITSDPACSGCHAEGICGISGKVEKIIDVKGKYNVSPGDQVIVEMEQSTGYKAVILGYILPLVILISCLVILFSLSFNELSAGLISIASLLPYFLVLYLFRKRINRSFTFRLKT
jgi:sigma-E factor negative regulatory protein RseC